MNKKKLVRNVDYRWYILGGRMSSNSKKNLVKCQDGKVHQVEH